MELMVMGAELAKELGFRERVARDSMELMVMGVPLSPEAKAAWIGCKRFDGIDGDGSRTASLARSVMAMLQEVRWN